LKDFPKEYFYQIEGNTDLEVCILVGFDAFKSTFWVECNLTLKETKKILRYLGKKFNIPDEQFALSEGMRFYRSFLDS
jgi:hypothetical protein